MSETNQQRLEREERERDLAFVTSSLAGYGSDWTRARMWRDLMRAIEQPTTTEREEAITTEGA